MRVARDSSRKAVICATVTDDRVRPETRLPPEPATIDDYIASVPSEARDALAEVIRRVRAGAIGAEESISYKMATFRLTSGRPVFVAAWKKHISLHAVPRFRDELEARVAPYRAAKDTVRLPLRPPTPFDLVDEIVSEMQAGI